MLQGKVNTFWVKSREIKYYYYFVFNMYKFNLTSTNQNVAFVTFSF